MGEQAYAPRRSLYDEYVPLVLLQLNQLMEQNQVQEAIQFLDELKITNEIFKEHLMELCMNRQITGLFDKLSTQ